MILKNENTQLASSSMFFFYDTSSEEIDIQYIMTRDEDRGEPIHMLRTAPNDDYIGKIRKRLQEDAAAREEREKRRRKVLGDQLMAHHAQEVCTFNLILFYIIVFLDKIYSMSIFLSPFLSFCWCLFG